MVLDLVRSGALIANPSPTAIINPAPTYRTIRHQIFNGLPVPLRGALGLPLANQSAPVPIPTDGMATVLSLWQPLEPVKTEIRLEYDQIFNQTIPKPFCSTGPLDYLRVTGPLRFVHQVKTGPFGRYSASFSATGTLDVVPVNPLTGEATGPAFQAEVFERHRSSLDRHTSQARHWVEQTLLGDPRQSFQEGLAAGTVDHFLRQIDCGPATP